MNDQYIESKSGADLANEYIECEVIINDAGEYGIDLSEEHCDALRITNEYPRSLSEAVDIPGLDGINYEKADVNHFREWIPYFRTDIGAPLKVRFRVPVERSSSGDSEVAEKKEKSGWVCCDCGKDIEMGGLDSCLLKTEIVCPDCIRGNPEPPKCEDCANKEGKYCDSTAKRCGKLGMEWWEVNDCEFERTLAGKCGPDGKCFVPKERATNSGDVARKER